MYNNKFSDQLLPLLTPEMLTRYPDQTCDIINKLIRLAQKTSSAATTTSGGEGNLEDIVQTTTSYADGGVNIVTAYLSDGTTQDFQIRNGHKGSQGDPGATGVDATVAVGTTTTLPAGSNATVTNVGVPSAAVLNFGIPKGDTGAPGQDGTDGYSPTATVTKTGDTAVITITDLNGTTTATVSDGTDANVVNAYSTSTTDAYSASYINSLPSYYDKTADNLTPASDTPTDWITLLQSTSTTGVPQTDGYFVTWYSTVNCFTNQPSQWGFLETFVHATDIYQRWHEQSGGSIKYRSGNGSGWNPSGGAWATAATTGQIPTVNNKTLTIQKNGSNVATFTANSATDVTANITVPTSFSSLSGTVATSQIAANAVTIAKLADTGWLDCTYASGYKTSSNTAWKKLQARVVAGILYMRGGVSKNSGNFAENTEVQVATLPSTITNMITNTSNMNATGRGSNFILSAWTVTGTSDTKGRINVYPKGASCSWCSTPACFGPVA